MQRPDWRLDRDLWLGRVRLLGFLDHVLEDRQKILPVIFLDDRRALAQLLLNDKEDGVRAAAAVSLGEVGDETAVVTLANVLSGDAGGSTKKKSKGERNTFVLRAVARSLGQIKSRAAVPALITALTNEKFDDDIRREAARSLGMIGDPTAVPALRAALPP